MLFCDFAEAQTTLNNSYSARNLELSDSESSKMETVLTFEAQFGMPATWTSFFLSLCYYLEWFFVISSMSCILLLKTRNNCN